MTNGIEKYLEQLRLALAGSDPATIQDALSDAEEYLRDGVDQLTVAQMAQAAPATLNVSPVVLYVTRQPRPSVRGRLVSRTQLEAARLPPPPSALLPGEQIASTVMLFLPDVAKGACTIS